jgi:hypothetical protein
VSLSLALGLVVLTTTGCASTDAFSPSGSATTLMYGWELHFTLEWTVEPEAGDARQLKGYVNNLYGGYATDVRLLAQALDASGTVVGRRIAFVPAGVPGFGRSSFVIQHLPPADHYQVSVWTYDFHQGVGDFR